MAVRPDRPPSASSASVEALRSRLIHRLVRPAADRFNARVVLRAAPAPGHGPCVPADDRSGNRTFTRLNDATRRHPGEQARRSASPETGYRSRGRSGSGITADHADSPRELIRSGAVRSRWAFLSRARRGVGSPTCCLPLVRCGTAGFQPAGRQARCLAVRCAAEVGGCVPAKSGRQDACGHVARPEALAYRHAGGRLGPLKQSRIPRSPSDPHRCPAGRRVGVGRSRSRRAVGFGPLKQLWKCSKSSRSTSLSQSRSPVDSDEWSRREERIEATRCLRHPRR